MLKSQVSLPITTTVDRHKYVRRVDKRGRIMLNGIMYQTPHRSGLAVVSVDFGGVYLMHQDGSRSHLTLCSIGKDIEV